MPELIVVPSDSAAVWNLLWAVWAGWWTPPSLCSEWFMSIVSNLAAEHWLEHPRLSPRHAALVIKITHEEQTDCICLLLCNYPNNPTTITLFLSSVLLKSWNWSIFSRVLRLLSSNAMQTANLNTTSPKPNLRREHRSRFPPPDFFSQGWKTTQHKDHGSSCYDRRKHWWTRNQLKSTHILNRSTQTHKHTEISGLFLISGLC